MSARRTAFGLVLLACSSDGSPGAPADAGTGAPEAPYPPGPYGSRPGEILEARTFTGLTAAGEPAKISYGDLRTKRNLVIRVQAGFCGTCRVGAEHLTDAIPQVVREESEILDVVVRDEDGATPTPELAVAARWQRLQDVRTPVVIDAAATLVADGRRLPRVLIVDPPSMKVLADLDDPTPREIAAAVEHDVPEELVDGRFTKTQWAMIQAFPLEERPPPDPSNAVADDLNASILGLRLFEDEGLGPTERVSCKSCHEVDRQFTDGSDKPTRGVGHAERNTPTVVLAGWQRWQFWDGRADTLWQQALGPLENPEEVGSSRSWVAHRIANHWREAYESVFGPMPRIDDGVRFPFDAKPGDPAWEKMAPADQQIITRIFVNAGKAMAAYERTFTVTPNAPDRYARGDRGALTDPQKDGLAAYFEAGCAQCHWGPRLTDDAFHVLRFPSGHEDFTPDEGRIGGGARYETAEFRADSAWADAPQPRRSVVVGDDQLGAFKTPALRGVVLTPPYGHGGGVSSLEMAIELHRTRGMPPGAKLATGKAEPWLVPFDARLAGPLLEFASALTFAR